MAESKEETSFDENGGQLNSSDELNTPTHSPPKQPLKEVVTNPKEDFPFEFEYTENQFLTPDGFKAELPTNNISESVQENVASRDEGEGEGGGGGGGGEDTTQKEENGKGSDGQTLPGGVIIKKEKGLENGEDSNEKSQDERGVERKEERGDVRAKETDETSSTSSESLFDAQTTILEAPTSSDRPPMISVRKAEDLMSRVPSLSVSMNGNVSPGQTETGPPPVQQLAEQVQRLPAQFTPPHSYPQPSPSYGGTTILGSGVVLSPVSPSVGVSTSSVTAASSSTSSPQVPNLPPGIQLSKRPAPTPPQPPSPKIRREEEPPSTSSIRLPNSITLVSRTPPQPKNNVADILANRGITVVASGKSQSSSHQSQQTSAPALPRSLMNTSAISITPSSQVSRQPPQNTFAVPAAKTSAQVSKVFTVDLTKEEAPARRSLGGPGGGQAVGGAPRRIRSQRQVCQICDKAFPTPLELQQHMSCHQRGAIPQIPQKLAFECRECTAQYPTEAGLQAHRRAYHAAGGPSPDMAIPVVDMKQSGVLSRLAALGIRALIPLSQLHSRDLGNGLFGLPVVAIDAANNPAICNIGGLGASNLLPLGPLKNLNFNNMR